MDKTQSLFIRRVVAGAEKQFSRLAGVHKRWLHHRTQLKLNQSGSKAAATKTYAMKIVNMAITKTKPSKMIRIFLAPYGRSREYEGIIYRMSSNYEK
jgi:hypothetical protein